MARGDIAGAEALFQEALETAGTSPVTADPLTALADLAACSGDFDLAKARLAESVAICEAHGEYWARATALWNWAVLAWRQGEIAEAARHARASLQLWAKFQNRLGIAQCAEVLAWTAAAEMSYERAAGLLGAADALLRAAGASLFPELAEFHRHCQVDTRRALGERAFTAAARQSGTMTFDDLLAYALGESATVAKRLTADGAVLTRREQEIAELVAQGLSNREIASRLVIAQRTAEGHIEHILAKLNFTSRAQIAAWAAEHRASIE
jgi:non-specific serine/threonine protein kinase